MTYIFIFLSVYIITTADVHSASGSPSSVHSQDITMTPQPSTSYPTCYSPQMPLIYTNLDQPTTSSPPPAIPSCSSVEPIDIAPIPEYDMPKSCIAPVTMTSAPTTSHMGHYHGMFATIKQEPMASCSGTSTPLQTIGTVSSLRGMSPMSSRSSPALSHSSSVTPPQRSASLPKLTQTKHNIHLWQFLRELLLRPETYSNCIRWLDRSKGNI